MTLTSRLNWAMSWDQRWDDDANDVEVRDKNALQGHCRLGDGRSINQADKAWHDRLTIADGASVGVDLYGGTFDARGVAMAMARAKMIVVRNRNTAAGELLHVGGGANALVGWVQNAGDSVILGPDGVLVLCAPSMAGIEVTASTADVLRLTAAGGDITCDVVIVGSSPGISGTGWLNDDGVNAMITEGGEVISWE